MIADKPGGKRRRARIVSDTRSPWHDITRAELKARKPRQPPPPLVRATLEESDFRHGHWWQRRQQILNAMKTAAFPQARIERFINCGAYARVLLRRDTGQHRLRASYCHDRFCQPCSAAKSLQIADNLTARIQANKEQYKHVVLTMKHREAPLAPQIDRLFKCFKALRNRPLWKQHFTGGIYFLQNHIAEADGLWHVHLHVIAQGSYCPHASLSDEWHEVTGDSSNVHLSAITDAQDAAREVSRYAAKPIANNVLQDLDKLQELMRAMTGRHLCASFGIWRAWRVTAKPKPDPTVTWEDVGSLFDWIRRAQQGDLHAKLTLQHLTSREIPAIGPPTLFGTPVVVQ